MSLLMDLLKKLGSERTKSSTVYPLLGNQQGKKSVSRKELIVLSVLFLIAMTGTYIISELFLIEKTPEERNTTPPPVEIKKDFPPLDKKNTPEDSVEEKKEKNSKSKVDKKSQAKKKTENKIKNKEKTLPTKSEKDNTFSLLLTADTYFKEGKLSESMKYYEKALAINPSEHTVNNLMVIYIRLGLYEKASKLLKKFTTERLVYTYTVEMAKKGSYIQALKTVENFLDIDKTGLIVFTKGYLLDLMGKRKSALENYRKAYEKNPSNPYFVLNYARLLELEGKVEEARKLYIGLRKTDLESSLRKFVEERISLLR